MAPIWHKKSKTYTVMHTLMTGFHWGSRAQLRSVTACMSSAVPDGEHSYSTPLLPCSAIADVPLCIKLSSGISFQPGILCRLYETM